MVPHLVGDKPRKHERKVQESQESATWLYQNSYICTMQEILPILFALYCGPHHHPFATQGNPHIIHQTLPRCTSHPPYWWVRAIWTAIWCSSILSVYENYFNTFWSTPNANSLSNPIFPCTSSFSFNPITNIPNKFTCLLYAPLTPQVCAQYYTFDKITPSSCHYFACIPNRQLLGA